MPSPAVQTPFHPTAAQRKSRRVYVKQVLPFGKVDHPEAGTLEFTPDLVGEMVETFKQGAMTQVPFVLCDEQNRHTDDPERYRGEVTALEQRDDGLYARVETTERGASLLEDNPTQPVSIRMLRPTTGKFAGKTVLGHVAATLDEVAKGMHPWEQIDASSVSELTDLSDGTLTLPDAGHGRPAGEMAESDTTTLTDEDQGLLRKLLDRVKARGGEASGGESAETAELTDEQVDEILADVLKDAEAATAETSTTETETETGTEEEEVAETAVAALSAEDRQSIDLANSRAEEAAKDAREARAEANLQRFERESAEMKRVGIPPAAIDLARPVLEHGLPEQIDLSNGEKVDAARIVRGLLDQMKGTIDFSELGAAEANDNDVAQKQRREAAEAAAKGWA